MGVKDVSREKRIGSPEPPGRCYLCQTVPASIRVPFAVGRPDSPPLPREHRTLGLGPRRKRFVQRYRWVWQVLWLCPRCHGRKSLDPLWEAIQSHATTRRLVEMGYTETRLDPGFEGQDGDVTLSEEPI